MEADSMKTFYYVKTEQQIFGKPQVEVYIEQVEKTPMNSRIIIGNWISSKDYFESLEMACIFAGLRREV
jgi:hypothetical protein